MPVGDTALIAAAAVNNLATIRLLMKAGADVNRGAKTSGGQDAVTSLMIVITKNHPHAVLELLHAGADANARGSGACSPLKVAAKRGNVLLVTQLLDVGGYVRF